MTEYRDTATRPSGVTLIAIYHLVTGGLAVLGSLVLAFMGFAFMLGMARDSEMIIPAMILFLVGMVVGVLGIGTVAIGWGLLRLKDWARWAAIVLAALGLANVPVGTVIGGLIIWYLLQDEVRPLFAGH